MNLLYISNQRMPTEKAYGLQISHMCEAFAAAGCRVTLLTPFRFNAINQDFFSYYGITQSFKWKKVIAPDFYFPGTLDRIAVNIKRLLSAIILSGYALFSRADIIYSRDEWPLYFLSFFRKKMVFEMHTFSPRRSFYYRRFLKAGVKIVVISQGLKNKLMSAGFPAEKILVAPDGVDVGQFQIATSREQCRQELGLPQDKKIIGYVGQLRTMGEEKGVGELIRAFGLVRREKSGTLLVIVGGASEDIRYYQGIARVHGVLEDTIFTGRQEHARIPKYLKACDVLAMPFPAHEHYAHYMSPLKLFEYMAAQKPIVVSDLPSLREMLNEENAFFVSPGNPEALAAGIIRIMDDPARAERVAHRAFEDVREKTWRRRAEHIIHNLSTS